MPYIKVCYGALETMDPEQSPPVAESVLAAPKLEEMWRYSKHGAKTKSVVRTIQGKISTHIQKTPLSQTVNTITGYDPFKDHLARMRLTDEPSCPKRPANTDSNIRYIFDCIYYRNIGKGH